VLEFLLGRAGVFAGAEVEHRYVNQLREGGGAFDHLQSRRCPVCRTAPTQVEVWTEVASSHTTCHRGSGA